MHNASSYYDLRPITTKKTIFSCRLDIKLNSSLGKVNVASKIILIPVIYFSHGLRW